MWRRCASACRCLIWRCCFCLSRMNVSCECSRGTARSPAGVISSIWMERACLFQRYSVFHNSLVSFFIFPKMIAAYFERDEVKGHSAGDILIHGKSSCDSTQLRECSGPFCPLIRSEITIDWEISLSIVEFPSTRGGSVTSLTVSERTGDRHCDGHTPPPCFMPCD